MKRKGGAKKSAGFDAPFIAPQEHQCPNAGLSGRISEIEGDLVRIVELIVKGDIDSVKFKEILTRRQGNVQTK